MKKKILSIVIVLCMLTMFMQIIVNAESVPWITYGYLTFNTETGTITGCDEEATGDLVIPKEINGITVTEIGGGAFVYCSMLTSITIPDGVLGIGHDAFNGCRSLTSIEVSSNNPNYSSDSGVLFNKNKTILMLYPAAKNAEAYTIPDSVKSIDYQAFGSCKSL